MKRLSPIGAAGVILLVLIAGYLLFSGEESDLDCRRVALTDRVSGSLIQGAEDLALDPFGGRLILSAYDRRSDAPGGIYTVSLDGLLDPRTKLLTAERLAPLPGAPGLRPHGFGLGPLQGGAAPLAVIERKRRASAVTDAVLQAYVLAPAGLVAAGPALSSPALCNANDVAVLPEGGYLVTADRGSCHRLGRYLEDVLGLKRGRVLSFGRSGVQVLASRIGFANGIALDAGHVYVAATRERALLVFSRAELGLADGPPRRLALSTAPDNLAWGDDGALYVAGHVSLPRFALFRLGLRSTSASAIYRYDPSGGDEVRPVLLGEAGGGEAVSGATVALGVRGHIVLGAGFDAGLSVCTRGEHP